MDANPHSVRPLLRHRLPPAVRTAMVGGGIGAFPIVLALTVVVVANDHGRYFNLLQTIPRYALPALVMALPAVLLWRSPLTTLALMLLGSAAMTVLIDSWEPGYLSDLRYLELLAIDLVVGFVAATRPRRLSVVVAALVLGAQLSIGYVDPVGDEPVFQPEIPTLAMLAAWWIGDSVRARRRYAETLRAQATAQAVTAERLRIARELHDMVAHSIGIIAIQAGMGSRVMDTQPTEARAALRAIEATSRETLAGLRRVLGGLRQATSPGEPGVPPLDPTPGLTDLDRLVLAGAEAGVRVELRWRGRRRPVPADIELSAYRIVQEAVTNVLRHAGTPECRVTVDYQVDELCVEIVDDGRGGPVAATGYGITGMRERVGLLHGRFEAGPRTGAGFRVAARLPLPEAAATPAEVR